MMYLKEPGKKINCPILAWLLASESKKILVDTGGSPPDGKRYQPYVREAGQDLENQLKARGVSPEEIHDIVLTHLHWDHAGANDIFSGANFYAQQKEIDYARSPLPIHVNSYDHGLVFKTDYKTIDGPADLFAGLSVILTPGHSPGSQSVIVNTAKGKYVIVGDLIALYSCFEADPMIANGIHTDLYSYYESLNAIKNLQLPILPGHDPKVLRHIKYPI
jgi:glyoxylase-like metal-dependent hydrolase (beta-lactamase superfamily II)